MNFARGLAAVIAAAVLSFLSFAGNVDQICNLAGADSSWCSAREALVWMGRLPLSAFVGLYILSLLSLFAVGMRYAKQAVAGQLARQAEAVAASVDMVNKSISTMEALRARLEAIPDQVDAKFSRRICDLSGDEEMRAQGRRAEMEQLRMEWWEAFGRMKADLDLTLNANADEYRRLLEPLTERVAALEARNA